MSGAIPLFTHVPSWCTQRWLCYYHFSLPHF